MTVFNLGSINVDLFYQVAHLPMPGETLPATSHQIGLGGKGANQSVAVAKAGSLVRHIGMTGADNDWIRDRLAGYGIDLTHVGTSPEPTGHAIINVDAAGENAIVTFAGANYHQSLEAISAALADAEPGDI
ncbi:MAG TPA: ribokinase, partial [Rhodobacterales bacterium]|nr:ribokinase [Rhodobacterales bacterium]